MKYVKAYVARPYRVVVAYVLVADHTFAFVLLELFNEYFRAGLVESGLFFRRICRGRCGRCGFVRRVFVRLIVLRASARVRVAAGRSIVVVAMAIDVFGRLCRRIHLFRVTDVFVVTDVVVAIVTASTKLASVVVLSVELVVLTIVSVKVVVVVEVFVVVSIKNRLYLARKLS